MDKRKNLLTTIHRPYFSVILPAYNVPETFLRECMAAMAVQTFNDFEMIFVDDGSNDRTADICEGFDDEYPDINVKCVRQVNSGQIAARMNGFDHSCGEHILFFDSDDTVKPNALERIKSAFDRYGCDIVMFNAIRDYGDHQELFWNHLFKKETLLSGDDYKHFLEIAISGDRLNNVWLKCFKRDIIQGSERYDKMSRLRLGEDFLMQLPWFGRANSVTYLPENLYIYRYNTLSIMNNTLGVFNRFAFENAITIYTEQTKYATIWGIKNAEIYTNRKFFAMVSSCLKQIRNKKSVPDINLIEYLKGISNNDVFRKEYKNFEGGFCPSQIGRILIVLTYFRLYPLVILCAVCNPLIHGNRIK